MSEKPAELGQTKAESCDHRENPRVFPDVDFRKIADREVLRTQAGLSLRDYFATNAMAGLLAGGEMFRHHSELAAMAYEIADAMLKKGRES